jgi:predicted histidine transporter YuiF (NhaC family)
MSKERPILKNLIKENMSEIELFQNKTIRPIIKMQHNLLMAFLESYQQKRKIDLSDLSDEKKKSKIKAILEKDISFRNIILGSILGHFSMDEYFYYNTNASEMNKRIIKITIQRFQDSI